MKPSRALVSVYDKSGITDFARELSFLGIEIISTGGTAKVIREAGIDVVDVSDVTGFPEIFDGRVKTLHPVIHGGILARRTVVDHQMDMKRLGIRSIDMVVANFYPFKDSVLKGKDFDAILEDIDIGGPAMVRAAAKNFRHVVVLVSPEDYSRVVEEIRNKGEVTLKTRFELARKAFNMCAHYDALIAEFFFSVDESGKKVYCQDMRTPVTVTYEKVFDLRYGENPHQRGAFYKEVFIDEPCVSNAKQLLSGKELSFNNIYDLDAAFNIVMEFDPEEDGKVCAIIKHANPCGVACADSALSAYERALATDPVSAFGGIIAFNCNVDFKTASMIVERFFECVIAPDFDEDALKVLSGKKNLRVLSVDINAGFVRGVTYPFDYRKVTGGILVQDRDLVVFSPEDLEVVSNREPTAKEWEDLLFAFRVVKWVKSNAIVYAKSKASVGIGVGQTSRVDAVRCAAEKARLMENTLEGSVLASEAFFPFRDSVDEAAKYGVTAIIQPGGSKRDKEVIEAANEHNIAMVFTGMRHFRH